MNWLKNYLNYVSLGLLIVAVVILAVWPQYRTAAWVNGGAGIVALAVYLIVNLSALKEGLKRRSFIYSSNLVLIIILVLAILVVLNFFLARHHYRLDFTSAKIHSLSEQSVSVAKNLKQDVVIKAFFRDSNVSRQTMENLLKNYAYHSARIKYEFIDPDKNPGLVKKYDITQDGTTVFECGDKENRVTTTSEEDLTNAIIKVTREKKKTIYFLEGHGENSVEDSGDVGYSTAKNELEKIGYEVKKLTLALSDNFPADCALLIIPGPRKGMLPNELETIKNFLEKGGRVMFLVDPETSSGLETFLANYGIKLENDLVVDTVSRLLGGDYFMPVVTEYQSHDITKNFRYATFFPLARSVEISDTRPEGLTLNSLASTSANSWSERQLDKAEVTFDQGKDRQGPISLAVVGSKKVEIKEQAAENKPEENKEKTEGQEKPAEEQTEKAVTVTREARLAVFGDSDFISNKYYNLSGNGNFFQNTVNWLTEEADLISIQPRTRFPRSINLTPSQGRFLLWLSVILLPLAVLITGLTIWIRRRSL
ncbi:MAG: GldG family protein [Candidatus Saccharicenans sp.]|uniref:GldG family protein n=1 Tax=Candidatus Saccharicenans sp. TaxID=2819258 RepID=UPI00404A713D